MLRWWCKTNLSGGQKCLSGGWADHHRPVHAHPCIVQYNVMTYLWNGTEVEDTLVLNAWHVFEYIRHMLQGVGDEVIQTVDSIRSILFKFEVR